MFLNILINLLQISLVLFYDFVSFLKYKYCYFAYTRIGQGYLFIFVNAQKLRKYDNHVKMQRFDVIQINRFIRNHATSKKILQMK